MKSVLFYHALVYEGFKFLSLSGNVSFPCLPGTHFLQLRDQNCNPSSPGSHKTTSSCPTALQTHSAYRPATFQILLEQEQSTAALGKNQVSSVAGCLQFYPHNCILGPNFCIRFVSHPEPASQVGQSQQPYPSWSFIWYCLKGTRGSSRSWGTGKDPRSSDAGASDGCCGHIWNSAKQNSLLFLLATGRLTQIKLQHKHGSCIHAKGKQTFHVWLPNRPHANGYSLQL